MSSKDIATNLKSKVRDLAAKYPDAKYTKCGVASECFYTKGAVENGPRSHGCIIGQAIRRAMPDRLKEVKSVDNFDSCSFGELVSHLKIEDFGSTRWFEKVQYHQDIGKPWSEAVRLADIECS